MHSATKHKIAVVLLTAVVLVLAALPVEAAKKAKKIPSSGPFTLDFLTLYGFFDNSPPGLDIADPVIHSGAGGKGTFQDPITFAVAPQVINSTMKPGTKIYIPSLQKYFIVEDLCTSSGPGGPGVQGDGCENEFKNGVNEFDLWIGATNKGDNPGGKATNSQMTRCEDRLTTNNVQVIIKPASNLTVNTTPLLNHGHCIQ